jgi:hypothetical protein
MSDGRYPSAFDNWLVVGRSEEAPRNDFASTGTRNDLNRGEIELADGCKNVVALRPIEASSGFEDG